MQKQKFKIKNLEVVLASGRIVFDEEKAQMQAVNEDVEYVFDVITCAARPVEFSIVNQLYKLDKQKVIDACEVCNSTRKIGILTTNKYHLILSPFVERHTFFGKDQAYKLTIDVMDECNFLGAESLRITQFTMMRGNMPFFDQCKGIIEALSSRLDLSLKLVYFDVPDKYFYELTTLFGSY
jgi:hypothetical protein